MQACVIMATYNAEDYIEEQLNSIENQTYKNIDIYIHDDGSTDETIKIIKNYKRKYNNIYFIEDNITFKSSNKNFFHLMKTISRKQYEYIFFSDQDDIWDENKVSILIKHIKKYSKDIPVMVHTDAVVVNCANKIISPSFNKYADIEMEREDFISIALNNNAQGSSMVINKKCLDYINVNQNNIDMYDHYMSMITAYYGKQEFINTALIRYRQHESNVIGAIKSRRIYQFFSKKNYMNYTNCKTKEIDNAIKILIEFNKTALDNSISNFINILKSNNFFKKIKFICKKRLYKKRKIKHLISILIYKYY